MSFQTKNIYRAFLDFFWPNRCPFCGEIIPAQKRCCASCYQKLPSSSHFSIAKLNCAFSCTDYTPDVAHAVHRFKFKNQPQLAKLFADLMTERLGSQIVHYHPDYLCSVAMTSKRRRQRGYNQATLLAQEISLNTGIPFLDLLQKTRSTPAQHTLNAAARKTNLIGSYTALHPEQIKGKRILIIDDIITTGSTMNECADVLLKSGAVWVGGICFARPTNPEVFQRQIKPTAF